jgi:hypothetical protein
VAWTQRGGQIEDRRGQGTDGLGTGAPFPLSIGKGGGGIGMLLIVSGSVPGSIPAKATSRRRC